jgi:hypothetical protein
LWVLIAVALLTAWLFGPALIGTHTFVFRDGAHYFPPLFGFNVEQWRAGQVPLWNPYEQIGLPALAENTASVFYPGQLILLLPIPFLWAYNLYVVAHVALAAYGAFRLARYGGASVLAAGQAGLAYAFSGSVLFQYCNVIFLVGAAWLPFALAATDRLLRGGGLRSAIWLGLFWALMVLGGDPQTAYHAALLAAAYACYLTWLEWRVPVASAGDSTPATGVGSEPALQRGFLFRRLSLLAAAAGIGLVLAAVQILPTWELAALGPRARHDLPRSLWELAFSLTDPKEISARKGASAQFAPLVDASAGGEHLQRVYEFSVGLWRWPELVWPNISGRQFPIHRRWVSMLPSEGRVWAPSLFCGAVALVLAFGGWRLRASDPRLRCCGWMTLLAVLAGLGEYGLGWLAQSVGDWVGFGHEGLGVGPEFGGVYWLMNLLLPGYVAFRYPAKLWTIAALGISLLAARGWDTAWSDDSKTAASRFRWLAVISACLAVVVLLVRGLLAGWLATAPPDPLFGPLDTSGALNDVLASLLQTGIVCGVAMCLLVAAQRPGAHIAAIVLLLLSAGDLAVAHRWLVPCVDVSAWRKMPEMAKSALAEATDSSGEMPRIYRDSHWLPLAWKQEASPNRLTEMFLWDRETLWPKYHLPLHIGSVESSGMLIPDDYLALWEVARARGTKRWVDESRIPDPSVLDLLGASRLVLPPNKFEAVSFFLEDRNALPRAWIVHRVIALRPLDDDRPRRVRLRTEEVLFPEGKSRDWRHEAVVESAAPLPYPPAPLPAEPTDGGETETCRIETYQPQRVVLNVQLASPGLVVLADLFYPGWEFTVDDGSGVRPAEILRTNRVLRGVSLPAGKFRLEFRYRPAAFRYGAWISSFGWLGLATAMGYRARGWIRRFGLRRRTRG